MDVEYSRIYGILISAAVRRTKLRLFQHQQLQLLRRASTTYLLSTGRGIRPGPLVRPASSIQRLFPLTRRANLRLNQ
jgi:hypothetical protein